MFLSQSCCAVLWHRNSQTDHAAENLIYHNIIHRLTLTRGTEFLRQEVNDGSEWASAASSLALVSSAGWSETPHSVILVSSYNPTGLSTTPPAYSWVHSYLKYVQKSFLHGHSCIYRNSFHRWLKITYVQLGQFLQLHEEQLGESPRLSNSLLRESISTFKPTNHVYQLI